ncbi:MAG: GNAT family N-acetyltransferase [Afipia sp.]
MTIVYRPAQAQDLERTDALVVGSINDLTERHGFGAIASTYPPHFQMFSLQDDPAGLWVAEDNNEIVGFAWSWVCGDLWFLAQLFVSPDRQGAGIGDELIRRTFAHAQAAGATRRALITFSFNTVSQGLYIRHGLLPRFPIYTVSIARDRLVDRLHGEQPSCVPLEPTAAKMQALAEIDIAALGVSREKHHRFLMNDSATRGVTLHDGAKCVGYAYVSTSGHVGPLAVTKPESLGGAFRAALNLAVQGGTSQVSAFVPGTADECLKIATEGGMRIKLPMVLMATRNVGDWVQYMPRNPGFM